MTGAAAAPSARPPRSVFAGADVCALAGLNLPAGAARPVFEDQVWDFTEVTGLRVQMQPASRRFDFTVIINPRWRLVARELVLALLAPRHEAVAPLPRAYRTPLHLGTARGRFSELTRWLNWLTGRGITSLGEVDDHCCQAYLAQRRQVLDEHGTVIGDCSPATRRAAAQVVVDLLSYGELFTADRLDPRLRPWGGASASAVAEMRCGRDGNKTPPVDDTLLQPMLAAALYLVTTLGPHVAALHQQIRHAGTARPRAPRPPGPRARPKNPAAALAAVLDRHRRAASRCRNWTTPPAGRGSPAGGMPQTRCWPSTSTRSPGRPASCSSRRDGFRRCAATSSPHSGRPAPAGQGRGPPPACPAPTARDHCRGRPRCTGSKQTP